jgi:hypothetical protein
MSRKNSVDFKTFLIDFIHPELKTPGDCGEVANLKVSDRSLRTTTVSIVFSDNGFIFHIRIIQDFSIDVNQK